MTSEDRERLSRVEEKIGYCFTDKMLLKQALTHSSFANELHEEGERRGSHKHFHNERLEFLGDAVLELVSSEYFYRTMPEEPEGEMTKSRAAMVCEPTLALCARQVGLDREIYLGKGEEKSGGRNRDSVVSDAFEAVIGAMYLDGGLEAARTFILAFVLDDIEHKRMFYDSKSVLQELIQAMPEKDISYVTDEDEESVSEEQHFSAKVLVAGQVLGVGYGRSKKQAEKAAAYEALLALQNMDKKERE